MYVPVISLPTLLPPSLNSLNRCSVPYSFKRPLVVFDSLSVLCLKGTLRTLLGLDDYRTKTCKQGVLVPSYLRTINLVSQTPLKNTVGVLCLYGRFEVKFLTGSSPSFGSTWLYEVSILE